MLGWPALRRLAWPALVVMLVVLTMTAGCGLRDRAPRSAAAMDGPVSVEASFYPLQWMASQVGGDAVDVKSLTKPGAEPHDLELNPSDVADLENADVVIYLGGFQPAVDDAVRQLDRSKVFDVAGAANLDLSYAPIENGARQVRSAGTRDPHFWLDPTRLSAVAKAFATYLGRIDPAHASRFVANATALNRALGQLDRDFERGLGSCASKDLVTSHNAFGYLARRYGLTQIGITGLTPEDEPSPADLAAVSDFVKLHQVRTVYFETLASPVVAEAVARDAGVATAVLDPIEGLNKNSKGHDYLEVMRANLAAIETGQPCP